MPMINIKELVDKIQSVPGVSVHIPDHDIISIGNGSGYNPRIQTKGILSAGKIESDFGQEGVELNFYDGRRLIVTEVDFIFSVVQSGFYKVGTQLEAFAVSELRELLNSFRRQIESPNLDAVMGAFYQAYYILESAVYFGFELNRLISQLHDNSKDLYFFEREQLPLFNGIYLGNRGLKLQKLKMEDCYGILDFINFWKGFYAYGRNNLYERIHKPELTKEDLTDLFVWKNGMNLSVPKKNSFESKIVPKLGIINELRRSEKFDLEAFLNEFKSVSVVWKIFLLHIVKPNNYPIYDQHVHRAYQYMNDKDFDKIRSSMSEKKKLNFYLYEYLPFVNRMEIKNLKEMDEAFFAFGQFLNINNQKELMQL
jgi:hypothetical protein